MSQTVATPLDPIAFIRAETRLRPVPLVPEISLHVADEAVPLWQRTEEELGAMGLPPPFWAFAWAGGQALARYVLDHPETVAGKNVLDFASGSGLVGLAALRAGAASVTCADIDSFARAAIVLNHGVNAAAVPVQNGAIHVPSDNVLGSDAGWDTVLAGDICYERDLAAEVFGWLKQLQARGATVLMGDPGRTYLPREQLEKLDEYEVPVTRELEDLEIKRTGVWRPRPGAGA
ncbi:ribosomal protein L11 methyltransferase [Azorhizobium oxalatiphilum]|uniref:Ribosomal protein L11 methyltransferase n=1 Tax=Azorhizobium oxalatiphilum TaxID=980631 RepID=A0A917FDB9_9HYPH|nr:methyltransferase [Azorhizobium oxalatiphilum]GGF64447.1 ribosomal protein L11 methyltransferase [Azorhizobium oxalatiphilum]